MEGSSGKDSGCADEAGNKPRSLRRNKGTFAERLGVGRISPLFTRWGKKWILLVLSWVARGWWCGAGFGPLACSDNRLLLSRGQGPRWSWR